jgi:hypothetical protein
MRRAAECIVDYRTQQLNTPGVAELLLEIRC